MAGKKTEKDLLSDFFGDDDLDWLDEEESKAAKKAAAEASSDDAAPASDASEGGEDASVAAEDEAAPEAPAAAAEAEQQAAPPPPPPPVPRRTPSTTLPPQPAPELEDQPVTPAPKRELRRSEPAPMPDQDPEETLVAAPVAADAADLGGDAGGPDPGRDSMDETIGAFLEPLDGAPSQPDPDAMETVTDASEVGGQAGDDEPSEDGADGADGRVEAAADEIVVEEDAPEDLAGADASTSAADERPELDDTIVEGAPAFPEAATEPAATTADGADAPDDAAAADDEAAADDPAAADDETAADDEIAAADDASSEDEASEDESDGDEASEDESDEDEASSAEQAEPAAPALDDDTVGADVPAPVTEAEAPPPPMATWAPQDEADSWREVLRVIEAAAAEADGDARTRFLLESARIRRDRLGDLEGARDTLTEAGDTSAVLESRSDVSSRMGDLEGTVSALVARAGLLEGAAAAECFQAAAMIARHRLQDLEAAEAHLRAAVEADATDYASLSLLRDQLSAKGREADRADVLGQISGLTAGRVAAEAWWELGRLRHRLGEDEAALAAYRAGREADPTHGPCFLAIQAMAVASADDLALGALYQDEGTREGQDERGFWMLEAARAFVDSRERDRADAAFVSAVEAGHPLARREQQAWFLATDRPDAYTEALTAEIDSLEEGREKAFALFRLGRVHEDAERHDEAVEAYREAVRLDPAAGPAAEGVARVLQAASKSEDLLAFWEDRLEGSTDETLRRSVMLRMAEVAQAGLGDDARTRALLEKLLQEWPQDRPALHMLRRTYQRLQAWKELAETFETLARLEEEPDSQAQYDARAGNVWRYRVEDVDKAREAYGRALDVRPAHVIALDEQVDLLEEVGDWSAQARLLRSASDAMQHDADRVRTAYHAGQVYLDRLDDAERAAEAFRHCLRLDPGYLPALGMLKQIAARTGQGNEVYRLYLQQADGLEDDASRHWRMLAAADLAARLPGGDAGRDLASILEKDPTHPGAVASQELRMLTMGAKVGLLNLYRRLLQATEEGDRRSALLVRVAHLFEALGDAAGVQAPLAEAVEAQGEHVPHRALARLAEGQRLWAEAASALDTAGTPLDRLERARLLAQRLGRHEEALSIYADLLEEPQTAVGAALGAAALAQRAGDAELLLKAHAVLAEHGETDAVRAAHALWSGQLAEAGGHGERALELYRQALSLRPASTTAFDGARRQLLHAEDSDGLKTLWQTHRPEDRHSLALDLEQVGDPAGVVAVWESVASEQETPDVTVLARLEVARAAVDDWRGVFEAVSQRVGLVDDAEVKAVAEAKRRWLLAEKLADTEEAWELYQRLHEENPEDPEVLSALARIALARGETRMAIGYLETLASGSSSDAEAADLRVRTAEVHRAAGDLDDARQAYLDALDHVNDHGAALDGLKSLAREREDWSGLLATLQREAGLVEGEAKVDLLVHIAETTADKLEDSELTKDAWREVLEESPGHRDALEALTGLCAEHEDWEGYLQYGTDLADKLEGEPRTALLGRLGVVAADELGREDASDLWERALKEGPPDLESAKRLEAAFRAAGDSTNTIRVLVLQAQAVDTPEEKARLIGDAAQLEADVRGDRADAARLFKQVLEAVPDDLRALRFLTEHLWDAGKRDDELFAMFERLAPRAAEGLDEDDFDVAMELSTFYYRHAAQLVERDRKEEALAAADKALEHNANHKPTLELQAPILIDNEAWAEANQTLKRLLQLTGGFGDKDEMARIYAQLGIVEHAMGRGGKATKRFTKALDLVPNHVLALKGQAKVLEAQGQWRVVLDVYNRIIYNAPEPADVTSAYLIKGRILDERLNREDKAVQHYERSLAYDANQPEVLLRLAEVALRREDWAEAASAASRGQRLVSSGALLVDLLLAEAIGRSALGDGDKATTLKAEALAQAKESELSELSAAIEGADDLLALKDGLRERLQA